MMVNKQILTMNSHGQITIPVSIRKSWKLGPNTVIVSELNAHGQLIVFPAAIIPKGRTLAGDMELQQDLKKIYDRDFSGSEFSSAKLKAEVDEDR